MSIVGFDNLNDDFNLFRFELKNFKTILEYFPETTSDELMNENGLVLPLYVIFNKFITLLLNQKGSDYIFFYELSYNILSVKKFLIENKILNHVSKRKKFSNSHSENNWTTTSSIIQ